MGDWLDARDGPYDLDTATGTETYYTRREVWHRLDAMLPDERNITVVTWDDPYGRRTDDGGFVYDALSREVEYGD